VSYHFAKPSFPLSLFVKQYWAIDDCLPDGKEHIQRIIPNGLMDLTFYLGNRPRALDKDKYLQENSILSGQQKSFYDIVVSGKLSMFSISFQPHGAKMFFDVPSNEFFDQNVPLRCLVRNTITELEHNLFVAGSFEGKICIVEKFLMNQLGMNFKEHEIKRIAQSIALINHAKGMITIEKLSSASCLSRKQYERTFLTSIGTSPKKFLRTIRFQNSLYEKQKNKNVSLTELAYNCGYFDQSHMIHDYRLLSGKTPFQYFSECEPYSDYFL
jgi:AraC-like DNA-binding protein